MQNLRDSPTAQQLLSPPKRRKAKVTADAVAKQLAEGFLKFCNGTNVGSRTLAANVGTILSEIKLIQGHGRRGWTLTDVGHELVAQLSPRM